MNPSTPNIPESDPAHNKFCCCPWPEPALIRQPALDNAQAQVDLVAYYSDLEVAQSAGTGEGLPPIGPGKYTLTYDEALEWIADQQPRPLRPDPHLAELSRQLMKAIDDFNPAVARVLLPIVAPGSEEWTPEMIAAASDDQLKEMLVAGVAYCGVRGRWQSDNEPPEPPPAGRVPHTASLVDRRQELREARVNEVRGPPPSAHPGHSPHKNGRARQDAPGDNSQTHVLTFSPYAAPSGSAIIIDAEIAPQFAVLIDLIDDCLGVKYLPLDMRLQIELVAGLLGLDRRWAS